MIAINHIFISLFILLAACDAPPDHVAAIESCEPTSIETNKPTMDEAKTSAKAKEALEFCKSKKFNTDFCILIDMSLHSGVNRFCIYDFKQDSITHRFLVGHGCCDHPWSEDKSKSAPRFSNTDGSHCSSLGKYKIGARGYSNWGVNFNYLLHGLDSTNANALKRQVVFHSWEVVSDEEIYPDGTPEGWGCPTLSNSCFLLVDEKLKKSKSPVLMWIYN